MHLSKNGHIIFPSLLRNANCTSFLVAYATLSTLTSAQPRPLCGIQRYSSYCLLTPFTKLAVAYFLKYVLFRSWVNGHQVRETFFRLQCSLLRAVRRFFTPKTTMGLFQIRCLPAIQSAMLTVCCMFIRECTQSYSYTILQGSNAPQIFAIVLFRK